LNFWLNVSFHPGDQNRRHLALDGINTPVSQALGSDQAILGAMPTKLLSHKKTICPGQVWVGRGLLIDRAIGWPRGGQG